MKKLFLVLTSLFFVFACNESGRNGLLSNGNTPGDPAVKVDCDKFDIEKATSIALLGAISTQGSYCTKLKMLTDIQADVDLFVESGMEVCPTFDDFKAVMNGIELKSTLGSTLPFGFAPEVVKTQNIVSFFNLYFKCASAGADEALAKDAFVVIMGKYANDNEFNGCGETYAKSYIQDVIDNNKTTIKFSGMLPTGTSNQDCVAAAMGMSIDKILTDVQIQFGGTRVKK